MPQITALDNVDLSVRRGQLTALVGPDGAGKTTLMRLIAGLMPFDKGELFTVGMDVQKQPQQVQDVLSYMPQKFGLYEDLSVQENLTLYADLHGMAKDVQAERFAYLLGLLGLASFTDRIAGKLSGGMKQKLGLACTLVSAPKLLLLDEPTAGVDPLSRRELWGILQQLVAKEQLSVFVSTAYMDEAALCKIVYVLNEGRILASGSPEELRNLAKGRCYQVQAPKGMPTRLLQCELLGDSAVVDAVPVGGRVHFITQVADGAVSTLARHQLVPERAAERLEDAFMVLLKEDNSKKQQQAFSQREDTNLMADFYKREKAEHVVDIQVKDLVKKFGDFTAVSHTSFQVGRGEVFGLLGPNGAGKTTTFRMLCGLLPATSGELKVAGVNLRTARTEARANIGYVAQKFSLYEKLTVRENLRFFGGVYGIPARELRARIEEIMAEFHLTERQHQAAENLPGGYRQRLSMAAALIHKPKILFLDEPTSGIDPLTRRSFWQQITRLAALGTTIIITTHFMDEAEYCDRMMIQDHGEMLILGEPESIRRDLHMPEADMNDIFIKIVEKSRQLAGEV